MNDRQRVTTATGRNNSLIDVVNVGGGERFEVGVTYREVTRDGSRDVYKKVGTFRTLSDALVQVDHMK